MVTALWSNDPEFYEIILGGSDIVGHVFLKVNCININEIINKFNLQTYSENIFIRSDNHKYICLLAENSQAALNRIKEVMKII